jgi:hypothetical protein
MPIRSFDNGPPLVPSRGRSSTTCTPVRLRPSTAKTLPKGKRVICPVIANREPEASSFKRARLPIASRDTRVQVQQLLAHARAAANRPADHSCRS